MDAVETVDAPPARTRALVGELSQRLGGERHALSERKVAVLEERDAAACTLLLRRAAPASGDAVTKSAATAEGVAAAAVLRWEQTRQDAPGAAPAAQVADDDAAPVATAELLADDPADGRPLLEAAERAVAHRGGGQLHVWAYDDAMAQVIAQADYRPVRRLLLQQRGLEQAPAAPRWPQGVTVSPFRPGQDEDALLAVNNRAFATHPEQGGLDRQDLAARTAAPWFDSEDVRCAWRDGVLLGFHWLKRHPVGAAEVPGREPLGEVYVLAVDPQAQGLGLGRALLRHGLSHLRTRGCVEAVLFVEADDLAVGLYASEGFATRRAHTCYARELGAEAPSPRGP